MCPERRGHAAALNDAIKNQDINAFFAAKDKTLTNFIPYKNASSELVLDCDSEEGTCWKHKNHMTKEQAQIRQLKKGESAVMFAGAGADGGSSYVEYDSYRMFIKNYGHKLKEDKRPNKSPVSGALYDKAKQALGNDTKVYVYADTDLSEKSGVIGFATAYDDYGTLDYVEYNYENNNGEIIFFTSKKIFKKSEPVTAKQIQKDVAKSRRQYHRSEMAQSASSG